MPDRSKPRLTRILCPVDFSDFSRHALDHALAIANWSGASVTVLHVVPPPMLDMDPLLPTGRALPPPLTAADFDRIRAQVTRFVRSEAADAVPVTVEVSEGQVVPEILEFAHTPPADLLVLGTHGRGGFERLLLGSVAERVLRKAPCPVLTVPRRAVDAVPAAAVYRRILCAVDFSPSSVHGLEYALALGAAADARVTAVHVVEAGAIPEPAFVDIPGGYQAVLKANAATRLHAVVAEHAGAACSAEEAVASGKPYAEILRVAAEQKSDLIVLGAHAGLAGLPRLGSNVSHVVREAVCPVLTLRA